MEINNGLFETEKVKFQRKLVFELKKVKLPRELLKKNWYLRRNKGKNGQKICKNLKKIKIMLKNKQRIKKT